MLICGESLLRGGSAADEEPRDCHLMYSRTHEELMKDAQNCTLRRPLCLHVWRPVTLREGVVWVLPKAWL